MSCTTAFARERRLSGPLPQCYCVVVVVLRECFRHRSRGPLISSQREQPKTAGVSQRGGGGGAYQPARTEVGGAKRRWAWEERQAVLEAYKDERGIQSNALSAIHWRLGTSAQSSNNILALDFTQVA